MPGLVCVSYGLTSILRPSMPPLALISSIARSMPFFQLVPTAAPPPDSSATSASLMRLIARTPAAVAKASRAPASNGRLHGHSSLILSFDVAAALCPAACYAAW